MDAHCGHHDAIAEYKNICIFHLHFYKFSLSNYTCCYDDLIIVNYFENYTIYEFISSIYEISNKFKFKN